ncbi:structure-specific endonuclease subunit SLX4 [Brachionichthys hirsutus]|uniref:structure-specific endonuclease subunit SLX4 n=1 Tax=Brachionichthys hirsutus TaxID=412623 RepID=UPI00360496DA
MDDSDQDFVHLRSKLLKRVRKKAPEAGQPRTQQRVCGANGGSKSRRDDETACGSSECAGTQPGCAGAERHVVCEGAGLGSGDAGRRLMAKDELLLRMQQFRRACPPNLVHKERRPAESREADGDASSHPAQRREPFSSDVGPEAQDGDEALALRLQQELNGGAAAVRTVDPRDGGCFCHVCHRALSHMTPGGRAQHLNRCLDRSERSGPAPPPPPPPPGVADCPICGKKFKSQRSRLAHLKRCSSEMGVAPTELLQALQRQAGEAEDANKPIETGRAKRKGPANPGVPSRKKPKRKAEPLDEDTMVALALSSSMLERETAVRSEAEAALEWRPAADKGRGRRKREAALRPAPFLLVQNAEAALTKLQERVSALLSISRSPSPPTPTRCTSSLPGWSGFAPLWQKSTLLDGGSTSQADFYTPELREFVTPWKSSDSCSDAANKHESVQPTSEGALVQTVGSTSGTADPPVGSQTLRDLVALAQEDVALTQGGYSSPEQNASLTLHLQPSSPAPDESPQEGGLCVSGFLPDQTRATDGRGAAPERGGRPSVALSRLASDLSSMVNNPQFCDVQLQVDSGEVYFAHSFMVHARCPLLAEMVSECGFGVQENGMPAAQRVLINDVPAQAVFALLQYLYTAQCSLPAATRPHVLELASRFDLQELQQLCKRNQEDAATLGGEEEEEEEPSLNQEGNMNNQADQDFLELLGSMWNEEDEDEGTNDDEGEERAAEEGCHANGIAADEREMDEEKVNEEELEEIYEFVATQRKKKEEEEEEGEDEDGNEVFPKPTEARRSLSVKSFEDDDGEPSSRHSAQTASSERPLLDSSARPFVHPPAGRSVGAAASDVSQEGCPLPPEPLRLKEEPELIVLSDSSDDADVLLCSHGSPHAVENLQSRTQIKAQPVPEINRPPRDGERSSLGSSPDCPLSQVQTCDQSAAEYSPEVSWLIPSTPLQQAQNARTGWTQTRGGTCRTKLFPLGGGSPPPRPVLPSPAPLEDGLQASNVSTTTVTNSRDVGEITTGPTSQSKRSHLPSPPSSTRATPLDAKARPYSSTPLHIELHSSPPAPLAPSALNSRSDQRRAASRGGGEAPTAGPEQTESGSFDLSPPTGPLDPHISYLHRGMNVSQSPSDSSHQRERAAGPARSDAAGEGQSEYAFLTMDDPPLAFNDSWALDVFEEEEELGGPLSPPPHGAPLKKRLGFVAASSPPNSSQPSSPAPPDPTARTTPEIIGESVLDSKIWNSWEEEEEESPPLPLSQMLNPSAPLETPASSHRKRRLASVPITPLPRYSDMDTPELKDKLNRFGVRPLPKRQMICKLREIHQYTHQLESSGSDDEPPPAGSAAQMRLQPADLVATGNRPCTDARTMTFKDPMAPPKDDGKEESGRLSASESSSSFSNGSNEDSERSNPDLCYSSDGESEGGISASQKGARLQDHLRAVRSFILSDSELYSRILQYKPLVLSQLHERLKASGIRLGAAKLVDFLDSQCITFTTAKPGGQRRGRKTGRAARAGKERKKKGAAV